VDLYNERQHGKIGLLPLPLFFIFLKKMFSKGGVNQPKPLTVGLWRWIFKKNSTTFSSPKLYYSTLSHTKAKIHATNNQICLKTMVDLVCTEYRLEQTISRFPIFFLSLKRRTLGNKWIWFYTKIRLGYANRKMRENLSNVFMRCLSQRRTTLSTG